MARLYARTVGGSRIRCGVPYARGHAYSLIAAIGLEKVKACLYGEWAVNGDIFLTYIEKCLAPNLVEGDIVIMDNVNFHKNKLAGELIEKVGAQVKFLPAYSPDFSPIENMWSKIKSILRKYAPRTKRAFDKAIKIAFNSISQDDISGWFKHCGYSPSTF